MCVCVCMYVHVCACVLYIISSHTCIYCLYNRDEKMEMTDCAAYGELKTHAESAHEDDEYI